MAVSGNPPLRDHSSETQAGSPLLSCHRKCTLAKILPSVVKPLEVRNVCWELCCADELGKRWIPSCRSQKGIWRLEAEAVAAVGEWVSFCFPTSPPKGISDSLWLQSQPVWHFLAKCSFPSHLHTYPSLYLNYQHLNFCGWLQPELGSSRWECPRVDKGLHFPPHTQVFFCFDFLTSTGDVLLMANLSKQIYVLWKFVSFFSHLPLVSACGVVPLWILWFYRYKVVCFQMDPNLHTHTWFPRSEETCMSAHIADSWVNQVLSK